MSTGGFKRAVENNRCTFARARMPWHSQMQLGYQNARQDVTRTSVCAREERCDFPPATTGWAHWAAWRNEGASQVATNRNRRPTPTRRPLGAPLSESARALDWPNSSDRSSTARNQSTGIAVTVPEIVRSRWLRTSIQIDARRDSETWIVWRAVRNCLENEKLFLCRVRAKFACVPAKKRTTFHVLRKVARDGVGNHTEFGIFALTRCCPCLSTVARHPRDDIPEIARSGER